VQVPPALKLAPAVQFPTLTTAKSNAGAPCIIAVMLPTVALFAKVNVSVCAELVCPTGIVPKFPVELPFEFTVTVLAPVAFVYVPAPATSGV
jgi:hypothetical protein